MTIAEHLQAGKNLRGHLIESSYFTQEGTEKQPPVRSWGAVPERPHLLCPSPFLVAALHLMDTISAEP